MNKYPINEVRANLRVLLEELPFEITKYGRVVAKVVGKSTTNVVQHTSGSKTHKEMLKKLNNLPNLCEHGAMKGLCKHGC